MLLQSFGMRFFPFFLVLALSLPVSAQLGGSSTYAFLNLPASARINAMGGQLNALRDGDMTLVLGNPAALNSAMDKAMAFNTALYFAGINFGYAGFAWHADSLQTTFAGGIQYVSYGEFTETNASGQELGTFNASEYMLHGGAARVYGPFRYGINTKFTYSQLESYTSFGLAADIGAMYVDTGRMLNIAFVVKNFGFQLKPYIPGDREPLPFDIQIGLSKQVEHLPFRLSVVVHHLQQFDIRYDDPVIVQPVDPFGLDSTRNQKPKTYLADKIARHFIIGGEFLLGDNLRLRLGYNHLRRQELGLYTRKGMAGFSFGVGIRISHFRLDYSMAQFNAAGSAHLFSLSTNLNRFLH